MPEPEPAKFQVMVDDNYHYTDEDARRPRGSFDIYEEALAAAEKIVIASVKHRAEGKQGGGEIVGCYRMFGEDAWIKPTPEGVESFSAWDFAETVAERRVRGVSVDDLS